MWTSPDSVAVFVALATLPREAAMPGTRKALHLKALAFTGRQDLSQLRITIASDGAKLTVGTAGQKLALINAKDFRVNAAAKPTATRPARTVSHHSGRQSLLLGVAALATV